MDNGKKIGFVGFGNMAQAIAKGLLEAKVCKAEQLYACAAHFEKLKDTADQLGVHPMQTAQEVVQNSDVVILAVKPYLIEQVVAPLKELLKGKMVVSVAAGFTFAHYQQLLDESTHHISTIPNTPIAVGEGIMICEQTHSLDEQQWQTFCELFSPIALIELVDSAHLSAAGTLGGCTPAFTAMYLEALSDAGVKYGLTRAASYRIAAKMLCGAGKLYLESGTHPGAMKDAVCSPGGTTIRGVSALEKAGFRGAVIGAIDAIEGK